MVKKQFEIPTSSSKQNDIENEAHLDIEPSHQNKQAITFYSSLAFLLEEE